MRCVTLSLAHSIVPDAESDTGPILPSNVARWSAIVVRTVKWMVSLVAGPTCRHIGLLVFSNVWWPERIKPQSNVSTPASRTHAGKLKIHHGAYGPFFSVEMTISLDRCCTRVRPRCGRWFSRLAPPPPHPHTPSPQKPHVSPLCMRIIVRVGLADDGESRFRQN